MQNNTAPSQAFMQKIMESPSLLYDALLRNGYYLPAYKSPLCSHQYLLAVKRGKCYAFKESDMATKNCLAKLTTKDLNSRLIDKLEASLCKGDTWPVDIRPMVQFFILILEEKAADGPYCLKVLATLHAGGIRSDIFDPLYQPVQPLQQQQQDDFNNQDGFFSNLPALTAQ
jgi:hypothetical protein